MMDPLWSETCRSTFKYFIILIVSTYYILCISWIIKCLIIIDARCKHEDSFVTSVCLYVNSAPTGRLFIKLYVRVFFGNLSRKFDFRQNLTRLTDTLHEDLRTAISCRILLRTRNIADKSRRENQNAILCSITPPSPSPKVVRLWDNVGKKW